MKKKIKRKTKKSHLLANEFRIYHAKRLSDRPASDIQEQRVWDRDTGLESQDHDQAVRDQVQDHNFILETKSRASSSSRLKV